MKVLWEAIRRVPPLEVKQYVQGRKIEFESHRSQVRELMKMRCFGRSEHDARIAASAAKFFCDYEFQILESSLTLRFFSLISLSTSDYAKITEIPQSMAFPIFERICESIYEIASIRIECVIAQIVQEKFAPPTLPQALAHSSETIRRLLLDYENLARTSGPSNAVDRLHTALHAYLKNLTEKFEVSVAADASVTEVFKSIRKLQVFSAGLPSGLNDSIGKVLQGFATTIDALVPLRNRRSNAHPSAELLGDAEALLYSDCVRTLIRYLDAKVTR